MNKYIEMVEEFHKKVDALVSDKPSIIHFNLYEFRNEVMQEENDEYLQACVDVDRVKILDALVYMQ